MHFLYRVPLQVARIFSKSIRLFVGFRRWALIVRTGPRALYVE